MRSLRRFVEGATYHVIARATWKELKLDPPVAKQLFLEILAKAKLKYSFRIDNFVIMGNHFHLLLTPTDGDSLSTIMKWILGVYTMAYNRVFNTWGKLWGDRYFSRPITSFVELLHVYQYIDNNPIRAMLVENPEDWPWSGLHHHRTGRLDVSSKVPEYLFLVYPAHGIRLLGV